MLQIVLKNYGYYESKIDGQFGPASKSALRYFQTENGLVSDGIIGKNTCNRLVDSENVKKYSKNMQLSISKETQQPSETLKISQQKLKKT